MDAGLVIIIGFISTIIICIMLSAVVGIVLIVRNMYDSNYLPSQDAESFMDAGLVAVVLAVLITLFYLAGLFVVNVLEALGVIYIPS